SSSLRPSAKADCSRPRRREHLHLVTLDLERLHDAAAVVRRHADIDAIDAIIAGRADAIWLHRMADDQTLGPKRAQRLREDAARLAIERAATVHARPDRSVVVEDGRRRTAPAVQEVAHLGVHAADAVAYVLGQEATMHEHRLAHLNDDGARGQAERHGTTR